MKLTPLLFVLAAGFNSCIGNLLLKWSRTSAPVEATALAKLLSPAFVGGMFFYAVNVVLFAKALDEMDVSIAYPLLAGVGFVTLAIASGVIFNEPMTLTKAAGMLLTLGGIAILARGS